MNLEVLEEVRVKAIEDHIPIIMDDTLEVIKEYLENIKPTRILEIGTAVGYSASQFIRFSGENCKIDTIELDEERANVAIENIKNIGLNERINVIIGNATEILPELEGPSTTIIFPLFISRHLPYSLIFFLLL